MSEQWRISTKRKLIVVESVTLYASVSVRSLKGNRLELPTPKSVDMYFTAGPRHACNDMRSKGQGQGHRIVK